MTGLATLCRRLGCWIETHAAPTVLIIIAVGGALRADVAASTYFQADEAWHALAANQKTLKQAYTHSTHLAHPPLFILALHFWVYLGHTEFVLRLLPVLAGTASLWFAYLWLAEWMGRAPAVLGVSLLSFSPTLIALTAELRQYSFLLLFQFAALYYLERLVKEKTARLAFGYALALALALLSHYSAVWLALSAGGYVLWQIVRGRIPRRVVYAWLGSQSAVALMALLLFVTHITKLERDSFEYLQHAFYQPATESLAHFLVRGTVGTFAYLFGSIWVGAFMLGLYSLGVCFIFSGHYGAGRSGVAILCVLPFVLAGLAGILGVYPFGGGPGRQVAFLYPFALAPALLAATILAQRLPILLPTGIIGVAMTWSMIGYDQFAILHSPPHRPEVMGAAIRYIEESTPSDAVLFCDNHSYFILRYYLGAAGSASRSGANKDYRECRCGRRRLVTRRKLWELDSQWDKRLQALARDYDLKPGSSIWIVCIGWIDSNPYSALRQNLPDAARAGQQEFSENLFLFRVEVPRSKQRAGQAAHVRSRW